MATVQSPPAYGGPADSTDVAELLRATVMDVLALQPADYDPQYSLAEMGCDSLDVMDILYRMEMKLGEPGTQLREPADFNPLKEPLARLERHVRDLIHCA